MRSQVIDIYFFSGTGNNYLLAKRVSETLVSLGKVVNLFSLEKSSPSRISTDHALLIITPCYAFSLPLVVHNFIYGLPNVSGTEVSLIISRGGFSLGLSGYLKGIFSSRGFSLLSDLTLTLPDNFFNFSTDMDRKYTLLCRRFPVVDLYCERLLSGLNTWSSSIPILSFLFFWFGFLTLRLHQLPFFRKLFGINFSKKSCTRCGGCIRYCPTGSLVADSSGYPSLLFRSCELCLRCTAVCDFSSLTLCLPYRKRYSMFSSCDFLNDYNNLLGN